jgi:hypothetical protein
VLFVAVLKVCVSLVLCFFGGGIDWKNALSFNMDAGDALAG